MTEQPTTLDAALDDVVTVTAEPGSRLAELHARYADAKATADEAAAQLKAITDAIKLELTQAATDGSTKIALTGESGRPLQLSYVESWRVDARKLKAEAPETYVRYAKKSGSWRLAPAKDGGAE